MTLSFPRAAPPPLVQELGATLEYDMIKDGNEYICNHSGLEIRVGVEGGQRAEGGGEEER